MTGSPNDDRRFSDEEFALILRRAAELQDSAGPPRTGMSLDEIQTVAAEAGIDPHKVAQVAALLPRSRPTGTLERLLGGPGSFLLEHTVPGEIGQEDLGRLLDVIRRSTKRQGQGAQVLDTFEWRSQEGNVIHVNVTPRDGQTTVQVISSIGASAFFGFFGSGTAWLIAALIIGGSTGVNSAAGVGTVAAGAAAGAFLTFRTIWKSSSVRVHRRLTSLMEALATTVDDAIRKDR